MPKILVTGGSGFIGSGIVRALAKRGERVAVLTRKSSDLGALENLPVELRYGDVYHPESLCEALVGIEIIYHAAAIYQFFPWWKRQIAPIYKTNVQGTRNVIAAAKEAGVKRFIYTSSVVTIGKNKTGGLSDETTPFSEEQLSSHYARSKAKAESLVLSEARRGFPAVVVNPGIVFGEGDRTPTPSGEPVLRFLRREYPGYFNTTWSVADVDDVAQGHLAACERGRVGERYILCNREHSSMKQIFQILEKISGVPSPRICFPYPILWAFVYLDEWSVRWCKHAPILPSEAVKFCSLSLCCDNQKAVRELGYRETPLETTLEKAVKWYRDHGYVRQDKVK